MGLPVQGTLEGLKRIPTEHKFAGFQVVPNGLTDGRGMSFLVASCEVIQDDRFIIPRP